ncbi:MAG: hypothetical protein OEQ13_04805 [Acidobacteriota bacterium]|nr:hypothetical protein [Acidobacteriota bacterium]
MRRRILYGIAVMTLVALNASCCEWLCEECPSVPAPSPGPMIVIQQTGADPATLQFYNQDTGMPLTVGSPTPSFIANDLTGLSVNLIECDPEDGTADNWMDVDEVRAEGGGQRLRLRKTAIGLFWYKKPTAGSESVLEPTDDAAYTNIVPTGLGSLATTTLEGDGTRCTKARFKVTKP